MSYRAALSHGTSEDPVVNGWTDATVLCPPNLDYDPGDSCDHWPASQLKSEKNKITAGHFFTLQILKV